MMTNAANTPAAPRMTLLDMDEAGSSRLFVGKGVGLGKVGISVRSSLGSRPSVEVVAVKVGSGVSVSIGV